MSIKDPVFAEQSALQFVQLTVELAHVESYSHELSVNRAIVAHNLHSMGMSFEEISDLFSQRGATISPPRVKQLAERGAARLRLKEKTHAAVSRNQQDSVPDRSRG